MIDPTSLESLGLTVPSPAYLLGAIVFGLVGFVAYRHGKKARRPRTKWLGVVLMVYPYVTPVTWLLWVVGAILCVGLYLDRR